jgi:hypothetical protein
MNKKLFSLFLLILLLFTGCQKKLGYGLLLWTADDYPVPTGSSLLVLSELNISNTYLVEIPESKEKFEVDKWRISLYGSEGDFQEANQNFAPYVLDFAKCQRNLPLREEPQSTAKNIYKLQEGQILKVLGRTEEKVQIGDLEGYWYKLLTEDGVTGYTFDYYLTVYSQNADGSREILNARSEEDILLDNVVNSSWRPDYYRSMLNKGMIDMNSFKDEYMLFINSETRNIYLKNHEREISVNYEKISNTAYQSYAFLGTTFRIQINSDTHLSVQYNYEDREYIDAFIKLPSTVEDILRVTQEARDEKLFSFIDNGPVYISKGYGELEFKEGGRFNWIKKETLISRKVVSSAAGNSGRISFNFFPDPSINDKYDGGFNLIFNNGEKLHFLYNVEEKGIQILYIPSRYINNQSVVTTDTFYDPITMFFAAPPKDKIEPIEENNS